MSWTDDPRMTAAVEALREHLARTGCYSVTLDVTTHSAPTLRLQGNARQMTVQPAEGAKHAAHPDYHYDATTWTERGATICAIEEQS